MYVGVKLLIVVISLSKLLSVAMQLSVIQHNSCTLSELNNPHTVLKVYNIMVIAHVVITL